MREEIGELRFSTIMQFILKRQSLLHLYNIPLTGHFIDYRGSMINWCPIGRNANDSDREEFIKFDMKEPSLFRTEEITGFKKFLVRNDWQNSVEIRLGGETSFDIYPTGWDKTYSLNFFKNYDCWFVGDQCGPSGNDSEIYQKLRPNGKSFEVLNTKETLRLIYNEIIPRIANDK